MQKKTLVAGASAALILAGLATAGPALADPAYVPNNATGLTRDLVGVGSDTTEIAMQNAMNAYSPAAGYGRLASFDAKKVDALGAQTNSTTVVLRQGSSAIPRPNGSGAGKGLLWGSGNNPDVSFARSSSSLNTDEVNAGLKQFPFAVDQLQMAVAGAGSNAPAKLTAQQIVGIYSGKITNWSEVGGKPGTIKALIPQGGSGTRSFFEGELKNANGGVAVPVAWATATQEHSDTDIKGDPNAIAPFSVGRARLLKGTVKLLADSSNGGWSAKRAVYNVVRGTDEKDANVQKVFSTSGFLCSPAARQAIYEGGLDQMASTANGGRCGVASQVAETNFNLSQPPAPAAKTVMVTPQRIMDTRTGVGAPKALIAGQSTRSLQILGNGGVPTTGVSAVILNVTAIGSTIPGYATAWPSGTAKPTASNVNFKAGEAVPNQVIVKVGPDGRINLSPSAAANMIVDVSGYYTSTADIKTFTPQRLVDTRSPKRTIPAGGRIDVRVTSVAGVPATGVDSVVLNVTAIGAKGTGWLTVFPSGAAKPNASNVNYNAGDNKAGLVVAKVGANGMVSVYSSLSVDVAVDIAGYYPTGSDYTSLTPVRAFDERPAKTAQFGVKTVQIAGKYGVPAGAKAVMLNVTATGATVPGAVTVWPAGVAKPLASVVNYPKTTASANSVLVKLSSDGKVNLSPNSAVSLIGDVQGYVM